MSISVNEEIKGEYVVETTDNGDFLIREEDIKGIGIPAGQARVREINGKQYVSLLSIRGVQLLYDPEGLTLKVEVPPDILPRKTINFTAARRPDVVHPKDNSAFLNYGLTYAVDKGMKNPYLTGTTQLGRGSRSFFFSSIPFLEAAMSKAGLRG